MFKDAQMRMRSACMTTFWMLARCAVLGLIASAISACSTSGALAPAPVTAATSGYNYIIGPGDSLNIIVWRNPELSMSVPVRPDGKMSTPLVEAMEVQGKTSQDVAREVEKALSRYVRDPVVTVVVTSFVGPYSEQIRVVGEAAKPQFPAIQTKDDAAGCDDCGWRFDGFCRWQCGFHRPGV